VLLGSGAATAGAGGTAGFGRTGERLFGGTGGTCGFGAYASMSGLCS